MELILEIFKAAWHLLQESSVYIIFGLIVAGLLRTFLNPASVVHHFGQGRVRSVFKASILGIPIPLCSCGVLPAAASLKKQGANNGAVTAFMISTPESGVDSIAITYALLDPIMTVIRPVVAFITGATAGIMENFFGSKNETKQPIPDLTCPVDGCCDGENCAPEVHRAHHTFMEKTTAGLKYAFTDLWRDLATWFMVGLVLAGIISALIPPDQISRYLGGGVPSMLIMLAIGIPLYICATASTPIAAALILKGVSPGAALVFLIAGPATNIATLTVLVGVLGRRATLIYLSTIAAAAVIFGLATDYIYGLLSLDAKAMAGQASELIPSWAQWGGAFIILLLSVKPVARSIAQRFRLGTKKHDHGHSPDHTADSEGCEKTAGPAGST
jgi:uncharacterized membrane protein YraQ (UPF0718 family)